MKFDTNSVHGGFSPKENSGVNVPPIYFSSAYAFDDVEHARRLFALEEGGNIYTRITNPTNEVLEKRLALLEGGIAGLVTSSGHAAITLSLLSICKAGDEIVSSIAIYGGAINLLGKTFDRMGIKVIFVDPSDPQNFQNATTEKTKAYFVECIGNPTAELCDLEEIAKIAKKNGILFIADNTFPTPYLLRPIEHGADIVIHSTTKYLSGTGTAMGGAIIDSGKFRFEGNPRYEEFNLPDESYHGVIYTKDFGNAAFIAKARTQILRDIGACQSPFNSWITLLGIETLSLRMKRHSENALAVAEFLEGHPNVLRVDYPALKSSKDHELYKKYFKNGASACFSFEIKGGKQAGERFANQLKLLRIVANLGDARSMVSHPASTTHSQLSEEQLLSCGISGGTIRLSIGLEDIEDIIEDLKNAL